MNPGHSTTAGAAARHDGGSGRNLEQVIDGLEQRLDDLARSQRTTRFVILGGSALLLGMMGAFGISLWGTLQRQLNAAQLQNALMAKIDQVGPPLGQKFMDSAMKAAPAYGEQALERFDKVRPQLETMVLDEAGRFADRFQQSMLQKSEAGMQRVSEKVAQDLKKRLPKLTEAKLDAIEEKLRNSLLVEGGGIADELQAKVTKEKERVEMLLTKLPVEEVAKQPEEKLHRQFIHHVLMMIDRSVAADETPATQAN